MKLLFFLLTIVFLQSVFGFQYDGDIARARTRNYIMIKSDNKKYLLTGATPIISTYINKLNTGDFISIEGYKNSAETQITVQSINYVGLKTLLGTWKGDDNRCYNFNTHTDFTVSTKLGQLCLDNSVSDYTYLINPNSRLWVMLVAGQYNSYVGDVNIVNNQKVEIDLYDSQTGEVVRKLKLNKNKE